MRVNRPVFAMAMLAASLMTSAAMAAEVVVRASGTASEAYREEAGTWADSPVASKVAGLPEGTARALQPGADGKALGAAVFRLRVPDAGRYYLDIAYPENANAEDAAIQVTGTSEPVLRFVDLAPPPDARAAGDKWLRVAALDIIAASDIQVRIEPNIESKPVVSGQPFLLAVDAVRLTTEDTASANASAVTDPAGGASTAAAAPSGAEAATALATGDDSPFADAGAPGSTTADSPFEMPADAAPPAAPAVAASDPVVEDPFATAGETADADPFSEPVAGAVAPPPVAEAPVAPANALSAGDTPFEGAAPAPAVVDDPFAAAPAGEVAAVSAPAMGAAPDTDPFGDDPSASSSSPFKAAEPATDSTSSPFETAGSTSDFAPAGSTAAATAPAPAPSGEVEGMNPFSIAETNVSEATESTGSAPFTSMESAPEATSPEPEMAAPTEVVSPEPTPEPGVELPFRPSIDDALKAARKTDRPVLVLFTGESAAANAVETAMSRPSVAQELAGFELVKIDYRRNRSLARRYSVKNYPYIVVMNKHGYTQGHVIPTPEEEGLIRKLSSFVQARL